MNTINISFREECHLTLLFIARIFPNIPSSPYLRLAPSLPPPTPQYVVPAGTNTMTMWIHMSDNSVQRYGDPKLEGWSETKMDPDVSGQAAIGGIASSDSQAFKMTFRCKPLRAASASLMSVTINLCRMSEDASGELLPCDSNHKWSNEAINLEFTKYCVHGPGGMGFWKTLWLLIVIFGSCGCVFGCYHKFKHEGARGLEGASRVEVWLMCVALLCVLM